MRQRSIGGRALRPHPANIVLVLGDIRQMREITEGPHDPDRVESHDQLMLKYEHLMAKAAS